MSSLHGSKGFVMLAALGFVGVSAAAVAVACGGSDGGTSAVGDGGGSTPLGGGTFGDSGDPADEDTDGGVFMAHNDAGCPVKYAGPNPGTIAESIARTGVTGGVPWTNPAAALTVDGAYAHADVSDGEETELLRVTGYGFHLPSNVTIKGVVVELKRQGQNQVVDGNIELWLDGMPSDRPKFVASGWPVKIGTHHYGQEVDTWGNDLTPELVGRPGFGTEIWARRRPDAGTGPAPADVESLIITVWYCE